MCLSIPMQVAAIEGDGDFAWVERGGRRELVNMMLIGPQPPGVWVLTLVLKVSTCPKSVVAGLIANAVAVFALFTRCTYAGDSLAAKIVLPR